MCKTDYDKFAFEPITRFPALENLELFFILSPIVWLSVEFI